MPIPSLQSAETGVRLLDRIGNTPLLRLERIGADFPKSNFTPKRNGLIQAVR